LTKVSRREKREQVRADGELNIGERIIRVVGIKTERIAMADKEAKQAVAAAKKETRGREQNTKLDEAIDAMIADKLTEISPSFKALTVAENDIGNLLGAIGVLSEAAESLETAGMNDVVDVDLGNSAVNMAMEMMDNAGVAAAREEVNEAVGVLNKALAKLREKGLDKVENAFAEFVDMVDVPLELLGGDGFDAFDALDMMGGFQTISDGSEIGDKAREMDENFSKQLRDIEKVMACVVARVRGNLGLE
jgi:hypothetical protein